MRIANILLMPKNGGVTQVFLDYCDILQNKLGHKIIAIVICDSPYINELQKLNIEIKTIKNYFGYHDLFAINRIKNILQDFNADAVIANAGRSMKLSYDAVKKIKNKKIKHISLNHSMNLKRSLNSDIIISINKKMLAKAINLSKNHEKNILISNGANLDNAKNCTQNISFNKKQIKIGVIGNFEKGKGFNYAIQAIKILSLDEEKKFLLKIAGSGEEKNNLKNLAKEFNIENCVDFVGWIRNKKSFFEDLDIFIMPSKNETFSLVVIEAIKFSKPVISFNSDGPSEILNDGESGFIVNLEPEKTRAERLAEMIKYVVKNENIAKDKANKAFDRLFTHYSFNALEKNLQKLFEE